MRAVSRITLVLIFLALTAGATVAQETGTAAKDAAEKDYLKPPVLADSVLALYRSAISETGSSLSEKPEPGKAFAIISDIKDRYVKNLTALGRLRANMNELDRGTVDKRIETGLKPIYNAPEYRAYSRLLFEYIKIDAEFQKQLTAMTTLWTYANFDLLKKQQPKEAQRLGIK